MLVFFVVSTAVKALHVLVFVVRFAASSPQLPFRSWGSEVRDITVGYRGREWPCATKWLTLREMGAVGDAFVGEVAMARE